MAPDAHGAVAGQGPGGEPAPQPIGTRGRGDRGRLPHPRWPVRPPSHEIQRKRSEEWPGTPIDPNPETLAYAGEPSCPRAVEDHSFESADQALEAALAQDPPAHPGKWRSRSSDKSDKWRPPSSFWAFFDEELEAKVEPEAARIGILGRLVAGVAFLAVLTPLLYVVWFLPAWLGIADPEEGWGPPCSALPLPRRSSRRISSQTRSGDATWPRKRTGSRPGSRRRCGISRSPHAALPREDARHLHADAGRVSPRHGRPQARVRSVRLPPDAR
jgi:hypothetical protein